MCGITGAIWTDPARALSREQLADMTAALAHRGPDDLGLLHGDFQTRSPYEPLPGIALGQRRLAIIDPEHGRQPMANETETVWVVFNGEIYNAPALRNRLEGAGHRFRTRCDTEVLVHLYEDEGPDCFTHLNGMFAVALWDSTRRRLVLGRDRLGQKPLVYRHEPGRLLFASELKSLARLPEFPRELELTALDHYLLYQYVPHPWTIYRGVHKLPPGCYAVYQDDRLTVLPYWQPPFSHETPPEDSRALRDCAELLEDAVRLRLQADVPLGVFLSGGIDSSLIAALAQRNSPEPIRTFSIGFEDSRYDESEHARRVAEHLGTRHHQRRVEADAPSLLPELVRQYDEPFADSSALPTWLLAQFAADEVKVALSGDGGDELFLGYERYRAVAWGRTLDALPLLRRLVSLPMWRNLPGSGRQRSLARRLRRFCEAASLPADLRYLEWVGLFNEARRAELFREDRLEQLRVDPAEIHRLAWRRAGDRHAVSAAAVSDLQLYLPCDLMTKVDIATMAHGLECRSPMLDYRLVERAARLPAARHRRFGRGKQLLRAAFGDLLPPSIWRRPKMGFGAPVAEWLRGSLAPLLRQTLLASDAQVREYLRPEAIERLAREHAESRFDHGPRLWALLWLELWLRQANGVS